MELFDLFAIVREVSFVINRLLLVVGRSSSQSDLIVGFTV